MKNNKKRILVAMSGGVDSSVAAALLLKDGYGVTGAFMVNYNDNGCWQGDYQDALRVAAKLGITLLRLDFQKEYKKLVLDYMYKEYKLGRTPNPDVLCNKFIKFGVWLKAAKKLGFDKLATGHYAKLNSPLNKGGNLKLLQAKDKDKDQTYFLNQLNQEQLKHVLFPLGNYLKSEVRSLARKFNLPTAEKEESMGICFVGEVPMKEFLQKKIKIKHGDVVMSSVGANGHSPIIIGKHDGLAFYTIGQRIGVSLREVLKDDEAISMGSPRRFAPRDDNTKPLYVVGKNIKKNQLIVGYENDPLLYKKEITVENINWISGQKPEFPLKCEVRLRHRQPLQKCMVCHCEEELKRRRSNPNAKKLIVQFAQPQRAPPPGQFAVFYKNRKCLGGGVIK